MFRSLEIYLLIPVFRIAIYIPADSCLPIFNVCKRLYVWFSWKGERNGRFCAIVHCRDCVNLHTFS